jgi:hypothetical protein
MTWWEFLGVTPRLKPGSSAQDESGSSSAFCSTTCCRARSHGPRRRMPSPRYPPGRPRRGLTRRVQAHRDQVRRQPVNGSPGQRRAPGRGASSRNPLADNPSHKPRIKLQTPYALAAAASAPALQPHAVHRVNRSRTSAGRSGRRPDSSGADARLEQTARQPSLAPSTGKSVLTVGSRSWGRCPSLFGLEPLSRGSSPFHDLALGPSLYFLRHRGRSPAHSKSSHSAIISRASHPGSWPGGPLVHAFRFEFHRTELVAWITSSENFVTEARFRPNHSPHSQVSWLQARLRTPEDSLAV